MILVSWIVLEGIIAGCNLCQMWMALKCTVRYNINAHICCHLVAIWGTTLEWCLRKVVQKYGHPWGFYGNCNIVSLWMRRKKATGTRILLSLLVRAQVERVFARLKSLVWFFIDVANILRGIVVSWSQRQRGLTILKWFQLDSCTIFAQIIVRRTVTWLRFR